MCKYQSKTYLPITDHVPLALWQVGSLVSRRGPLQARESNNSQPLSHHSKSLVNNTWHLRSKQILNKGFLDAYRKQIIFCTTQAVRLFNNSLNRKTTRLYSQFNVTGGVVSFFFIF